MQDAHYWILPDQHHPNQMQTVSSTVPSAQCITLNVRFECCRRHLGGLALHIHAHMSTRMGLMWMLMLRPERVVRAFAEEPHFTGRCTIDLAGFTKETTCDYRHCPAWQHRSHEPCSIMISTWSASADVKLKSAWRKYMCKQFTCAVQK